MNRLALSLFLLPLSAAAKDKPRTASVWTTAKDTGLRLTPTGTLTFADDVQPLETEPFIQVDPSKTFQTMIGIGAALTDASADVFAGLPKETQKKSSAPSSTPKTGSATPSPGPTSTAATSRAPRTATWRTATRS